MSPDETQEMQRKLQEAEEKIKMLEEDLGVLRHKWDQLFQSKGARGARRNQLLKMRCTRTTKLKFKAFVIDGNFTTFEEALSSLLQKYADQVSVKSNIRIAR